MSKPCEIEDLRMIFRDERLHICMGLVTRVALTDNRSELRCLVNIVPEERVIKALVAWDDIGPNAGFVCFPVVNDLVLVASVEGDEDQSYIIKRLSNSEDIIPIQAVGGHTVQRAKTGKKAYLCSDTEILVGLGADDDPDEPLVLGNVLKTFLDGVLDAILNASQVGTCAVGPVVLDPGIRTQLVALKAEFLTTATTNILSQLAFTERGGE